MILTEATEFWICECEAKLAAKFRAFVWPERQFGVSPVKIRYNWILQSSNSIRGRTNGGYKRASNWQSLTPKIPGLDPDTLIRIYRTMFSLDGLTTARFQLSARTKSTSRSPAPGTKRFVPRWGCSCAGSRTGFILITATARFASCSV